MPQLVALKSTTTPSQLRARSSSARSSSQSQQAIVNDATLQEVAKSRVTVAVAASGGGPAAALHVEALAFTVRYHED